MGARGRPVELLRAGLSAGRIALVLAAALTAGCGGEEPPPAPPPPAAPPAAEQPRERPPDRGTDREADARPDEPKRRRDGLAPVGEPYLCNGQELRRLDAEGPIRVEPPVVAAGQAFRVVMTDRGVDEALVSLGGVSDEPIFAQARQGGDGRLAVTLRVPRDATCGNKLLSIEGDVSAEAYVAVRR